MPLILDYSNFLKVVFKIICWCEQDVVISDKFNQLKMPAPTFDSFKDFYIEFVVPIKNKNPEFIRLDGKITGSTRNAGAYFLYDGEKWKVDADTYIDRLTIAFDKIEAGEDPFLIKPTLNKKGECLIIKDQPLRNKKFYVYKHS